MQARLTNVPVLQIAEMLAEKPKDPKPIAPLNIVS